MDEFRIGEGFPREEFIQEVIGGFSDGFRDLIQVIRDLRLHRRRHVFGGVAVVDVPGFVFEDVDGANDFTAFDNGDFKRNDRFPERFAKSRIRFIKRSIFFIDLIHEEDGGQFATSDIAHGTNGSGLNAFFGSHHDEGIIRDR